MRRNVANIAVGILLIALGAVYAGNHFGWWSAEILTGGWWALSLVIGAALLIAGIGVRRRAGNVPQALNVDGLPVYEFSFTNRKIKLTEDFRGCEVRATFSGFELDLTRARFSKDAMVRLELEFSGGKILLPAGVSAQLADNSSYGGVSNKCAQPENANAPKVYIEAQCSFGGLDVETVAAD